MSRTIIGESAGISWMAIFNIRSEADHESALARIAELMLADVGTPEGDELDILATLVEAYERKHFPIGTADPIEAISFRMEQLGDRVTATGDI